MNRYRKRDHGCRTTGRALASLSLTRYRSISGNAANNHNDNTLASRWKTMNCCVTAARSCSGVRDRRPAAPELCPGFIIGLGGLGSPAAISGCGRRRYAGAGRRRPGGLKQSAAPGAAAPAISAWRRPVPPSSPQCGTQSGHRPGAARYAPARCGTALGGRSSRRGARLQRQLRHTLCPQRDMPRTAHPLVSGAAIRWDGQITVFEGRPGGPCYRCLYTEGWRGGTALQRNGAIAPLVGIIGAMRAIEAIKLLCGIGESLGGRLLMPRRPAVAMARTAPSRRPACPVCGR